MQSKAVTVEQYLSQLPPDRRSDIEKVRGVILKNLDKGYEEGMQYGMIGYFVPHRLFPDGYHCDPRQPLPFAGLAAQKNYMSLYLMGLYGQNEAERWFRTAWEKSGKKLDMGKSCIRFKKADDLALDVIGEAIRRMPVREYITHYQASLAAKAASPSRTAASKSKAKAVHSRASASTGGKTLRKPKTTAANSKKRA